MRNVEVLRADKRYASGTAIAVLTSLPAANVLAGIDPPVHLGGSKLPIFFTEVVNESGKTGLLF